MRRDGAPVSAPTDVTIYFSDDTESGRTKADGTVEFRVPSDLREINSINVAGGQDLRAMENGPYDIEKGQLIIIELEKIPSNDVILEAPRHPNGDTDIDGKPSAVIVFSHDNREPKVEPEDVRLYLRNDSDSDLTLWMFDCWRDLKGYSESSCWKSFNVPKNRKVEPYEGFNSKKDGNGFYRVLVEAEAKPRQYIDLGNAKIFTSTDSRIQIIGSYPDFTMVVE